MLSNNKALLDQDTENKIWSQFKPIQQLIQLCCNPLNNDNITTEPITVAAIETGDYTYILWWNYINN